jgi:hypothetical protein
VQTRRKRGPRPRPAEAAARIQFSRSGSVEQPWTRPRRYILPPTRALALGSTARIPFPGPTHRRRKSDSSFSSLSDQCLSELVEPSAETTWRARGEVLSGGTNSSNPSPSSGDSGANLTPPIRRRGCATGATDLEAYRPSRLFSANCRHFNHPKDQNLQFFRDLFGPGSILVILLKSALFTPFSADGACDGRRLAAHPLRENRAPIWPFVGKAGFSGNAQNNMIEVSAEDSNAWARRSGRPSELDARTVHPHQLTLGANNDCQIRPKILRPNRKVDLTIPASRMTYTV